MRRFFLFLVALPAFAANYPIQVSVLLDVGAKSVIVQNAGTGGSNVTLTFSPGAGERVRFSITPGLYIPPPAGTTYSACAAPCSVSVNRNWGQSYYWTEYVDSAGNALSPRKLSQAAGSYTTNACNGLGTLPQVKFSTVTTSPMPMPLVVVGQDCYAADYQFPLVNLSGFTLTGLRLYLRVHNPGYNSPGRPDGKASVSINSGAWLTLTDAAATAIDEARFYGGIGSFDQVREFTLAIPNGTIGGSDTNVTMSFRFNGTEGITSGYRVLSVNILEANKTVSSIGVTTNVATGSSTSHGFSSGNTVLMQNAPGMYMRFSGLRTLTGVATNTFTFAPCGTGESGCTSPDGTYTAPVNTDTVSGSASTAQPVIYAARCLIAKTSFTQTDPSTWSAPGGGDATRGGKLFRTGNASDTPGQLDQLKNPNLAYFNDTLRNATCGGATGCHTSTGSDLKRFAYDNWAIEQRTIFHGFTEQDGLDIAAYIRGLSVTVPAKGKPWNPPMQPCPGMSTATTAEFFAGGGRDCVLTYAYEDMREYLFADTSKFLWDQRFEVRDMPLPYTFSDWNKGWIPVIHLADGFPDADFLGSTIGLDWIDISDMTPNNFASFEAHNFGLGQNVANYRTWANSLPGALNSQAGNYGAAGNWYPAPYGLLRQSAPLTARMRFYEIMVDFDTFKFGSQSIQAAHGVAGQITNGTFLSTPFNSAFHKFTLSYILNCSHCIEGEPNRKVSDYESNSWYWQEIVKGGINGFGAPDNSIDNAYLQAFQAEVQTNRPGGYMNIYQTITVPQNGNLQPDFYYHNGPASDGTDFGAAWSQTYNYFQRTSYPWFTTARWTELADEILNIQNALSAAHTTAYWDELYDNTGCLPNSPSLGAVISWTRSQGGVHDSISMMLPFYKIWGANATNITTQLNWIKTLDCGSTNGHSYDADLAAATDGTGTTNGAQAVTGDLAAGSVTVTFDTAGGHTGCPSSSAQASVDGTLFYTFWGGTGQFESKRPTGGTCVQGMAGTLTFNLDYAHTGAWKVSWGCDIGIPPNWPFNGGTDLPWWRCSNMF